MKSGPKPLLLIKLEKIRKLKSNLENNLSQHVEKIKIEQLTRRFARLTICSDMDLERDDDMDLERDDDMDLDRDDDDMDLEKVGPVISSSTSSLRFKS